MQSVVSLVQALAWPVTVLILGATILLLFNKPLVAFLDRTEEAEIDGASKRVTLRAPVPALPADDYAKALAVSETESAELERLRPGISAGDSDSGLAGLLVRELHYATYWELSLLLPAIERQMHVDEGTFKDLVSLQRWLAGDSEESALARDIGSFLSIEDGLGEPGRSIQDDLAKTFIGVRVATYFRSRVVTPTDQHLRPDAAS